MRNLANLLGASRSGSAPPRSHRSSENAVTSNRPRETAYPFGVSQTATATKGGQVAHVARGIAESKTWAFRNRFEHGFTTTNKANVEGGDSFRVRGLCSFPRQRERILVFSRSAGFVSRLYCDSVVSKVFLLLSGRGRY